MVTVSCEDPGANVTGTKPRRVVAINDVVNACVVGLCDVVTPFVAGID